MLSIVHTVVVCKGNETALKKLGKQLQSFFWFFSENIFKEYVLTGFNISLCLNQTEYFFSHRMQKLILQRSFAKPPSNQVQTFYLYSSMQ